jgi:tetratricopeptide (TPR) repeat protein
MGADEISKFVELADSLVYERTGQHLEFVEKEILRQILTGKKNNDIDISTPKNKKLEKSYVQRRCIPKLWAHLSAVIGQKVNKRNVVKILQTIQLQRAQLRSVNQNQPKANAGTELKGHSAQNPHLNSDRECSERLQVNGQMCEPLQASQNESQKAEDCYPDSTAQEFQQSDQTSHFEAREETYSSTFGLPSLMNKSGVPLLLSLGICGSLFGLSWLANWYGLMNYLDGQLSQAQLGYSIALKLNPSLPEARYNQGVAYEDQQNYDRAHAEYQLAIEGGIVEAYNNQARLYILQGNYDAALALLRIGLSLAKDDRVRANMYKNKGWARLEQGYYAQAKLDLTEAIKLRSDRASPYCLMAQVLERSADKGALEYWRKCLGYSYRPETPEEDKWIELASQRLTPRKEEK